jgi:hypothetical protein
MEFFDLFTLLQSLVGVLPSLGVLGATIYYLTRRQSADAVLMFVGSLVAALVHLFYAVGLPLLLRGERGMDVYQRYTMPISILSTLGAIAFAIGLFMLIHETVRVRNS